jgi:hypothetical protein
VPEETDDSERQRNEEQGTQTEKDRDLFRIHREEDGDREADEDADKKP